MKKIHFIMLAVAAALVVCYVFSTKNAAKPDDQKSCDTTATVEVKKVILDADVVDCFDDGFAMLMLEKSPKINLLGITTVSGNSWSREGVASAIYQLQSIGSNVPVYMGESAPFRAGRQAGIKKELESYGLGGDKYVGSFSHGEPADWKEYFKTTYGCEPKMDVQKENAVDYLIKTIHENPNEITIVAIGPAMNLAKAIQKDSSIVPLVKEIVFMGGAFDVDGNTTQNAEFNIWFDPEASNFVVHQPFKKQTFFALDVCNNVKMNKGDFDNFHNLIQNENIKTIYEKNFLTGLFNSNPDTTWCIWDVLAATSVINPELVTSADTCAVAVDTTFGMNYGKTIPYRENIPADAQKGIIVKTINKECLWGMLSELMKSL